MRKSIMIAVLAFIAGAASTWTLNQGGATASYKLSGASVWQTIDTHALTRAAGAMPSQQFDAH